MAILSLVLPMSVLIAVSATVLQRQENALQHTIDQAVTLLLPLATLEYDLQRALTDALSAETGQSVPEYGGLTLSIDRLFTELLSTQPDRDVEMQTIVDAQRAWRMARPSIEELVLQARPWHLNDQASDAIHMREQLTTAIEDLQEVHVHLATAIRHHAAEASAAQRYQLRVLVWAWVATLVAAFMVFAAIVYTIVKPARDIGRAVQQLGNGDLSVRVDSRADDELGMIARHLNDMANRFALWKRMLEDEAHQDSLTRLPNRRATLAALDAALALYHRQGAQVSVLMIDVDHFKQINDRFGHAVGDQALTGLAETMRQLLRAEDILGRYAGDEFLAVLPGTPHAEAKRIAQRLCENAAQEAGNDPRRASITVGVATTGADVNTAEGLIEAADRALYQGKRAGRGQVVTG
ncbi:hypothetical protein GCM10027040_15900 [Halomonas shantousis]